jgi:hypothetical protein
MARGFAEARSTTSDYSIYPSLFSALASIEAAQANLVNTAVKEQGSTTRAALKGMVDFDRAINTGTGAQWMRSLVDLTTAPLEKEPADPQLMMRVNMVRQANPGKLPTDPAIARLIWEDVGQNFSPSGQQAYGNVQQLKQLTGMYDDEQIKKYLQDNATDSYSVQRAIDMLNQAKLQGEVVDIQRSAQAELLPDLEVFLRQNPNLNAPEAQAAAEEWKKAHTSQLNALQSRLSPAVLQSAASQLNKPIELTGASKEAYDKLEADRQAMLAKTETPSERDQAAQLIASPMFQEWAKSNGLSVGHIEQPDPTKTYAEGQVTKGVGIYVPGPDDVRAVALAKKQAVMSPDKAHSFMMKAPAQWGKINVPTTFPNAAPAPVAAAAPSTEDFEGAGGFKYRRIGDKITLIGGPPRKTNATPDKPVELPPESQLLAYAEYVAATRLRANDPMHQFTDAELVDIAKETVGKELKAKAAPAQAPAKPGKARTEEVYGRITPMWAGDPIDSKRVNGRLYLYNKASDSYSRAPGQGELNAPADITRERVRPFAQAVEEYRNRRAANIARRAENLEPSQKYPFRTAGLNIAQTLTPTKQTAAEKARADEYAYQQEQARRQQETALEESMPQGAPSVTPAGIGMQAEAPPLQARGPSTSRNAAAQAEPPRAVAAAPAPFDQRLLAKRRMYPDTEGDAQLAGEERKFSNAARRVEARTPLVPMLNVKDGISRTPETRAKTQAAYDEIISEPTLPDKGRESRRVMDAVSRAKAQSDYESVLNEPASATKKSPPSQRAAVLSSKAKKEDLTVPTASTTPAR